MTVLKYRIATCSYSQYRPEMGLAVRASLGGPKWWDPPIPRAQTFLEIAPGRSYFRAGWAEFEEKYIAQLDRFGVEYIVRKFNQIGDAAGVPIGGVLVVLCFEKVTSWESKKCHRAMFRHWWARETGEVAPELSLPQKQDTAGDEPMTLFDL